MRLNNAQLGWLLGEGLHSLALAEQRAIDSGKRPLEMEGTSVTPEELETLSRYVLTILSKKPDTIILLNYKLEKLIKRHETD